MARIVFALVSLAMMAQARLVLPPDPVPVPEPKSFLLIGLGLAAFGLYGTRKQNNRSR